MTIRKHLLSICFSLSITPSFAANIYRPNTDAEVIAEIVNPYLPAGMTAILMDQNNPERFMPDATPEALAEAGYSQATFDFFVNKIRERGAPKKGDIAYAINGRGIPGNTEANHRLCAIVLIDFLAPHPEEILAHEAIHCRNAAVRDSQAFRDYLIPYWKPVMDDISFDAFSGYVDEAMDAGLTISIPVSQGNMNPPGYINEIAKTKTVPGNSIGTRTARNMLFLCLEKRVCPTDSNSMFYMIMDSTVLRTDLFADMAELHVSEKPHQM